jgi:hypothetical protein
VSEPFVARKSVWRLFLLAAGIAGFVSLGLWKVGTFGAVPPFPLEPGKLFWWFFSLLSCACLVVIVLEIIMGPSERVRVDAEGFLVRSLFRTDRYSWGDVERLEIVRIGGRRHLAFSLHEPTAFSKRMRFFGFRDGIISLAGTNRRLTELVKAVKEFRPVDG